MPNISESFDLVVDERLLETNDPSSISQYLQESRTQMRKMYEEIAIGVNNTYELTVISTSKSGVTSPPGTPLDMFPLVGMFYIMVSGLETNMPQQCSIIQKPIVGTAATFTSLSTFTPSSGTWNGVSIVLGALADQIGIGHDGSSGLEGLFNITILGQYEPQGGG